MDRAMDEMASIDPHLIAQLQKAGDTGEVEALLLMARSSNPRQDLGAGERLMDRVTAELDEKPTDVRYMPRLGALFVRGSGRLVRCLLDQQDVISASANDGYLSSDATLA